MVLGPCGQCCSHASNPLRPESEPGNPEEGGREGGRKGGREGAREGEREGGREGGSEGGRKGGKERGKREWGRTRVGVNGRGMKEG